MYITEISSYTIAIATLKQVNHNPILVQMREQQIEARKKTYNWLIFEDSGIPSGIHMTNILPPLDEKFERVKDQNFMGDFYQGVVFGLGGGIFAEAQRVLSASLSREVEHYQSVDSLHTFYEIARSLEIDKSELIPGQDLNLLEYSLVSYEGSRWTSDVEFGRQILNGVNCVVIERCTQLPDNFPITNQMVEHLLCRGMSLQMEMEVILCYFVFYDSYSLIWRHLFC